MNSKHPNLRRVGRSRPSERQWWAAPAAFLATLLALPASANIDIPREPLTIGARIPPNILFILDDSSSMTNVGGESMPNPLVPTVNATGPGNITSQTYVGNTVFYNPSISYEPWIRANGTAMTGGQSYTAVYSDLSLASGGPITLQNAARTFYVPKDLGNSSPAYLANALNYYRYQILTTGRVIRSEWLARSGSASNYNNGPALNSGCTTTTNTSTWRACTEITPTGRSASDEMANYATWYSYHRTRMKAAKAGAGRAFNELDGDVRVGFRTINGNHVFNIPVTQNEGRFTDVTGATNRTTWYQRLYGASENTNTRYTPLRGALQSAGEYFSQSSPTGPYGNGMNGVAETEQYSCRQNFAILTTDGYWNRDTSGLTVGNADGTSGPAPGNYVVEAPYRDGVGVSRSNTLADVAMHYWKTDLRGDLDNNVPANSGNPAFWQHMVTFGISVGVQGNVDPAGPYPGQPGSALNAWPDPEVNTNSDQPNDTLGRKRIDDLLHATVNGRGTFLAAADPEQFADGLKAALAAIVERTGSFSNVAANSTSLDAGSRVFQANYISGVWTGEMRSQPVSIAGGVQAVDCSGANQPANGWCASKGIPATGRNVFTSNGHNDGTTVTATTPNQTPRSFPSQATTAQLQSLDRPLHSTAWASGAENAAYIAGTRTLELSQPNGRLRNRNHLLGDIIGSSPAYVQDTGTLYIGANDGMLHAINAANGNELFAYIPGIINWNALSDLSKVDYAHHYFVDGPIVVTTRQQTPGENILVGALGKGGKGLFALDVSSPASFGTGNNIKWERADTPNGNMGLVQGRPILTKVKNGGATPNAVVLGNGVNSTYGGAALIVLDLDTGDVIREIAVGPTGVSNGLSAPAGVLGPDGRTLAYVYAGDMLGNVWKFDLTNASPASWTGTSLFTATAGGVAQPISGALTLAMHPVTNQRWVFFGTGRYLTQDDVASTAVQSMYGFIDDGTAKVRGGNLTTRTVEVTTGTSGGYPVRGFQSNAPLPTDSKGWYIDLPASGERIVQDAQVVSTFLIAASIIPSGDACESGGSGFINALDAFTGTSAGGSYFDLDGDGTTTDEVVAGRPVGSVNVGGGMPTLPNLLRGRFVVGGSAGSDVRGTRTLAPRWDRASWREIRRD